MVDLDAALEHAALPEGTVQVCLRADLVVRFEELERELAAMSPRTVTLADRGARRHVATAIENARQQMLAASHTFRLRGLSRVSWLELVGAHPPRADDQHDRRSGYNLETFFPALVRACLIDPAPTDEQWARLETVLSAGQFDELIDKALGLSRRKVDVPFSFAASATLATSDATSE